MKVLMLGWEFPPFISGGLGTACYGLTKGMSELGTEILLVLPRPVGTGGPGHVKFVGLEGGGGELEPALGIEGSVKVRSVEVALNPYTGVGARAVPVGAMGSSGEAGSLSGGGLSESRAETKSAIGAFQGGPRGALYGREIHREVSRYAGFVSAIAKQETFDVIHAHDWMTYPAGVAASKASGKPLVVHVHSTEFDRSGENVNPWIYEIERAGMERADQVIAVSGLTRQICTRRYVIPEKKIRVVYNAILEEDYSGVPCSFKSDEKVVLFLGRLTMQKGPEYFIAAAKKVLSQVENVKFIVAGSGDMMHRMIEMAAGLGIGHKILFAGFLRGQDVSRAFRMADLYVMPSVSEPFGIAPLEALGHEVPVIISRQSGVSEVLEHVLKVDFWDINELANKMVAVLKYTALRETLRANGSHEVKKLKWIDSARKCVDIYTSLMKRAS